jgi:hypothetical protein
MQSAPHFGGASCCFVIVSSQPSKRTIQEMTRINTKCYETLSRDGKRLAISRGHASLDVVVIKILGEAATGASH